MEKRISPDGSCAVKVTLLPFFNEPPIMAVHVYGQEGDTVKEVHRELHARRQNCGREVDLLVVNTYEEFTGQNISRPNWESDPAYDWMKRWQEAVY